MERGWTDFQRDCLYYIADFLSSIKALVTALGSDALELYCRNGCLDTACIDRVKSTRFAERDGDEHPIGNEDEDGDQESADEGTEDEDEDADGDGDGDQESAEEGTEDEDEDADGDGDDSGDEDEDGS